ncbi:hypothetical protein AO411_2025265 [Salmonella enterica subsp. enterica serovar Sarajane]|nr:hypothetical protein AO411_2025265 [Salmonella enterica subsp. enterica serovar Sarajane]
MTTITNNKLTDERVSNATLIRLIQWADQHNSHYVAAALCELQERRKADNQEPAGYHVIKECGKVGCSVATLEEAEKTRDFWNKKWTIRPYFYSAAPAPVVGGEYGDAYQGAREDLAIWKRRALEAESRARQLSQNYQHLSELYHAQEKRLFKIAQRIKGPAFEKYAHSLSQAIDVLESAIFGEHEEPSRSAMLNGGKS